MTAQTIDPLPDTMEAMPSYTVDDLFTLPENGNRYQVFGGSLVMSPAPAPLHQFVADELRALFKPLVEPRGAMPVTAVAVRITDKDGPVPDVTVADSAELRVLNGAVPLSAVYTVVEVVSPSSTFLDRGAKPDLYADAGIPCYWRVELKRSRRHEGPFPLVIVQVLDDDGHVRMVEGAAGEEHKFPLAVGPGTWIDVTLDPADLDTL
jgi:Uma2 family endonuclease